MKFKVGDKVRVKKELIVGEVYGGFSFARTMEGYMGKVVTIHGINPRSEVYDIEEDGGEAFWRDEMLEPIEDPLAEKVLERNNKPSIQEQLEENLLELLDDDKVNSPSHYNKGDIEVIDIIKQLTQGYEPFEAYLVGNIIKYLARANFKENKQQDLEKAQWHINKLLEEQNK